MTPPPIEVLFRVFPIRVNGKQASCFIVEGEKSESRVLVTAKHVLEGVPLVPGAEVSVKIFYGKWTDLQLQVIGVGDPHDVVVLSFPKEKNPHPHGVRFTSEGMALGQDVYFLGFPTGVWARPVASPDSPHALPLVKKACVSRLPVGDLPMLLDGHNNQGFSGGAVVFKGAEGWQVAGVVTCYYAASMAVEGLDGSVIGVAGENTGVVGCVDIRHVLGLVPDTLLVSCSRT